LDKRPDHRWSEPDIEAMGLDPSTIRRSFKRHFGMTFLEMARLRRLRDGFNTIAGGGRVIDAQLDAGFESASGFRAAFARLLGQSPASFTGKEWLLADWIDTPLGGMIAIADKHSLHLLEFVDRKALAAEIKKLQRGAKGDIGIGRSPPSEQVAAELATYFSGKCADFLTPLTLHGTAFTKDVWTALRNIPAGETRSYSALAQTLGNPAAVRAVARANGANQIAIIIPCHRVIGADGRLTGYAGGLWRKQKLIDLERAYADGRQKTGRENNVTC
jgi:AraC family transcriptional regulator of adaptative response/methylated-DNA-[protein]-cysteine methyltransferase